MKPFSVLVFLIVSAGAFSLKAHVALDLPTGKEIKNPGDTLDIKWHNVVIHDPLNWDLYYSLDSGDSWILMAEDLPTTQFDYKWIVPESKSGKCMVKVVQDNVTTDYDDISPEFTINITTAINPINDSHIFKLYPACPNPFASATKISFDIPDNDRVTLDIFCGLGREVVSLKNQKMPAGHYEYLWNPKSDVSPGLYYCRLQFGQRIQIERVIKVL